MAIKDDLIIQYYTLATNVSLEEIKEAEKALKKGEHPMKIKKELAFEIVEELYGIKEAAKALIQEGILIPKPTAYGLHVSLNSRKRADIDAYVK